MVPVIHCHGFKLTDAIAEAVAARREKLAQRATVLSLTANLEKEASGQYRVHIDCSTAQEGAFDATAKGGDLYSLIHEAGDKLLRQLGSAIDRQSARHDRERVNDHLAEAEA